MNGIAAFFPLVIAALPLLDAILVISRRLHSRRPAFVGDRTQFYDFLRMRGWPPRRVAFTAYVISASMCGIAGLILKCEFKIAVILCVTTVTTLLLLGLRLGTLKENEKPHSAAMIKAG